jgi:hypothetical protein
MIVNYTQNGWQVIAQRSHGLLAAQICAMWNHAERPRRWVDTLIATAEHDDVFNEMETGQLINPNGGPVDFKMNVFDETLSERLISRAEMKGSFIALLVSRHISFTHGQEPSAKPFLFKLQKKEKTWLKITGASKTEVNSAYKLLEFCDALSLLICQDQIPPQERKVEISSGPTGKMYKLYSSEGFLVVSPWPFENDEFVLDFECRHLYGLTFKNDDAFRDALQEATTSQISLKFKKQ